LVVETVATASAAPRTGRRTLLQFTFALSLITFLDRVAISSAAPAIRDELHLTPAQMGWVFSAFTFAYAIFEIPTGYQSVSLEEILTGAVSGSTLPQFRQ